MRPGQNAVQSNASRRLRAGRVVHYPASEVDSESKQAMVGPEGSRFPLGSKTKPAIGSSSPRPAAASMPQAPDYAEGCQESSSGTAPRADCSDGGHPGREHPSAATVQSASRHESSGIFG